MSEEAGRGSNLVEGFHHRNQLPHLKRAGATYFVTFRLAGTLPVSVVAELKCERQRIIENAERAQRPLTWAERGELFRWYSARVDSVLDRGLGHCWLSKPAIANVVADALRFFDGQRYHLGKWVVMPNHVHVLVTPAPGFELSAILRSWKGFTARVANESLSRVGQRFWHTESYDHIIRDETELISTGSYIEANPVKALICADVAEWPWSSAAAPNRG